MGVIFVNQLFVPGDKEGFGRWRTEHHYEHQQFNLLARSLPNPTLIPEYDILGWDDDTVQLWLAGHSDMHDKLREVSGLTSGVDLTKVDWTAPNEVFIWLENHSGEHQLLESFFGII